MDLKPECKRKGPDILCLRSNIVLIGMPGAGKSTTGVLLAKKTWRDFVDTDVLIQTSQGRSLQDIVDTEGHMGLRAIEESVLMGIVVRNHVISTGGSAVYSHGAMMHLKKDGVIVFLQVDIPTLLSRLDNFGVRGIARRPDQTFEDLFEERNVLYHRYADMVIECARLSHEAVCDRIMGQMECPPSSTAG